jgi:hypothetical protein
MTDRETYSYDEPTPADTVLTTADGPVIIRMGHPPIPVGCGAESAGDLDTQKRD